MRATDKRHRPIYMTAAMAMTVLLAATVLLAQDNPELSRQAAEQGDAEAQFNLGAMYALGEGVLKDEAEAVRWCRLAAEQGLALAQNFLGNMYALGRGVRKDYVHAHMWLNIASTNGAKQARESRDLLEDDGGMTRDEISRAIELARTCMTSDYKDCKPESERKPTPQPEEGP